MAFLARHGIGHHILPQEVNSRANIWALKSLGAERVVSISAVGSLREDYAPGDIVVPDQLIDFTKDRQRTFFGDGLVAHIGTADPFCSDLSQQLLAAPENDRGHHRIRAAHWSPSKGRASRPGPNRRSSARGAPR